MIYHNLNEYSLRQTNRKSKFISSIEYHTSSGVEIKWSLVE